jgi:uncharacterized protein YndB with AHSA1/START domain
MESPAKITVSITTPITLETAWQVWTNPEHIVNWNFASDDWCAPRASNDLKNGGTFSYRMEAKDGSFGFDLNGTYTNVKPLELIEYSLEDDRKVSILFESKDNETHIIQTFEAENQNPIELQQNGWQAIMNNYKKYAESL